MNVITSTLAEYWGKSWSLLITNPINWIPLFSSVYIYKQSIGVIIFGSRHPQQLMVVVFGDRRGDRTQHLFIWLAKTRELRLSAEKRRCAIGHTIMSLLLLLLTTEEEEEVKELSSADKRTVEEVQFHEILSAAVTLPPLMHTHSWCRILNIKYLFHAYQEKDQMILFTSSVHYFLKLRRFSVKTYFIALQEGNN